MLERVASGGQTGADRRPGPATHKFCIPLAHRDIEPKIPRKIGDRPKVVHRASCTNLTLRSTKRGSDWSSYPS